MKKKIKLYDETSITFSGNPDHIRDTIEDYYDGIIAQRVLWEVEHQLRYIYKYEDNPTHIDEFGEEIKLCKNTIQFVRSKIGLIEEQKREQTMERIKNKKGK